MGVFEFVQKTAVACMSGVAGTRMVAVRRICPESSPAPASAAFPRPEFSRLEFSVPIGANAYVADSNTVYYTPYAERNAKNTATAARKRILRVCHTIKLLLLVDRLMSRSQI